MDFPDGTSIKTSALFEKGLETRWIGLECRCHCVCLRDFGGITLTLPQSISRFVFPYAPQSMDPYLDRVTGRIESVHFPHASHQCFQQLFDSLPSLVVPAQQLARSYLIF